MTHKQLVTILDTVTELGILSNSDDKFLNQVVYDCKGLGNLDKVLSEKEVRRIKKISSRL